MKPFKRYRYQDNTTKIAAMKIKVDCLLEHDLTKHSSSPWSSPCLLILKCNSTFSIVPVLTTGGLMQLVSNCFPLARLDDCIDNVSLAHFVNKLNLLKGLWEVPQTPPASEISVFVTPDGVLQKTIMPFGMKNAPATFHGLINQVLVHFS